MRNWNQLNELQDKYFNLNKMKKNKYLIIQTDYESKLDYDIGKAIFIEACDISTVVGQLERGDHERVSFDLPIEIYECRGKFNFVSTVSFTLKKIDQVQDQKSEPSEDEEPGVLKDSIETVSKAVNESVDFSFIED